MTKFIDHNTALSQIIDWDMVANCLYKSSEGLLSREEWIENEKSILYKRLTLMQKLALDEFISDYWSFHQFKDTHSENGTPCFQVTFRPIDILVSLGDTEFGQVNARITNQEWQALQSLASKYSSTGDFDKLRIVATRLGEIVKETDLSLKPN